MKLDEKILYAAASSSFLISYLLHHPSIENRIYSDIVTLWIRYANLSMPIYIDLPFEYPPFSGLITYLSMALGGSLSGYYLIFSAAIFIFYLVLIGSTRKLASKRMIGDEFILIFLIMSPSMIIYMIYNFDVIFIALTVMSLFLIEEGKRELSAILFGLAALTKLINLILLPIILSSIRNWRDRYRYLLISIGLVAAVNLALYILSPQVFPETYLHHIRWGLEDTWLIYLFPDESAWNTAKLMSISLVAYSLLKVYLSKYGDLFERGFLAFSAFLLTNYVFTPQMFLWLLPFLALMGRIPWTYFIAEFANTGIILTWFSSSNPTSPSSLPQLLSLLRAIILFYLMIETYLILRRRGR